MVGMAAGVVGVVGVVGFVVADVEGVSVLVMVLTSVDSIIFSSIEDSISSVNGVQFRYCLKFSHASSISSVAILRSMSVSTSSVVSWRFSISLIL